MSQIRELIDLVEGEDEIKKVVNAIRRAAKKVAEVKQYMEKSAGKPYDDITDMDIRKALAKVYKDLQSMAKWADQNVDKNQYRQGVDMALSPLGNFAQSIGLAGGVEDYIPKMKVGAQTPDGEVVTIDVDISANDIRALKSIIFSLAEEFPVVYNHMKQGNFLKAVNQLYARMVR